MSTQKNNPKKSLRSKTITVTLVKGLAGCNPTQRASVRGLGLKRRHDERVLENTPAVRGMIKKVIHLVNFLEQ